MNCDQLLAMTGWQCTLAGESAIRAVAPLTLGCDGRHAAFYVAQPSSDRFYLTDAGETAMFAAQSGVDITPTRLDTLNRTVGVRFARFGRDLAITAEGSLDEAEYALWDAVKLAMSLSFASDRWMPKLDHIRFRALVESVLIKSAGKDRVKHSYRVQGISGHIVEFPLALQPAAASVCLIEPIALIDQTKVDWARVHQAYGRLSDVKQADADSRRLVVFEDGATAQEFGRAATLLAQTAHIATIRELPQWTAKFIAA